MTKKELEQLNDLNAEIKELENKISNLQQKKIEAVKDRVRASYSDFPYIQGHVTISGFDMESDNRRNAAIENNIKLLENRKAKAQKAEQMILEYINTVNDSRVRRIMQYRYIDGYRWKKIADIMHCDKTYPEKIISAYLDMYNDEN